MERVALELARERLRQRAGRDAARGPGLAVGAHGRLGARRDERREVAARQDQRGALHPRLDREQERAEHAARRDAQEHHPLHLGAREQRLDRRARGDHRAAQGALHPGRVERGVEEHAVGRDHRGVEPAPREPLGHVARGEGGLAGRGHEDQRRGAAGVGGVPLQRAREVLEAGRARGGAAGGVGHERGREPVRLLAVEGIARRERLGQRRGRARGLGLRAVIDDQPPGREREARRRERRGASGLAGAVVGPAEREPHRPREQRLGGVAERERGGGGDVDRGREVDPRRGPGERGHGEGRDQERDRGRPTEVLRPDGRLPHGGARLLERGDPAVGASEHVRAARREQGQRERDGGDAAAWTRHALDPTRAAQAREGIEAKRLDQPCLWRSARGVAWRA